MPGEFEIISRLRNRVRARDNVLLGIGDDAAVMSSSGGRDLIACCDLMVEGVHFRTEWTPPRLLGRKSLAVTLSDVAAMGAIPKFAMISVALPKSCSSGFIHELFEGILELADASGTAIIGGDTSSSRDSLFIDVSAIGDCEGGKAVTRRGATIGDRIYVSGSLGAAAWGLSLLEGGLRLSDLQDLGDPRRQSVLKLLSPEPQLSLGRAIGQAGLANAMIDISDGLSTDLWHILEESGVGAVIDAGAIPIAESITVIEGIDALRLALNGGEEYELLFTARRDSHERVVALANNSNVNVKVIGHIIAEPKLLLELNGAIESVQPLGYQHLI